jgi:raffinose/stachyose/melibiose transport system permease protein
MALTLYSFIAVGPLLLVLINSLRPTAEIYNAPVGWPTSSGAQNYATAWAQASFSTYFFNSVFVTIGSLVLGVSAATLAAYALGRIRFPGRGIVSAFYLAGLLLPAQLGVVPIFYILQGMGLIDTKIGLILVYSSQALPLSIFLLTLFFRGLPSELDEAARLDGAGEFRVFYKIMLPLVRPAIVTVVVVQTAPIWNDFFYPLILLRNESNYTLPVGLTGFFSQYATDFGALNAALVIVSLPLIVLFVLATKQVIAGLTAGIGK